MEISVAKAQAKLTKNIKELETLIEQDKKNREAYNKALEKADKDFDTAFKKWETDVKKLVLASTKIDHVSVNTNYYRGEHVEVTVRVNLENIKLPTKPQREDFRKNVEMKQVDFPERYDAKGYPVRPSTALYEMKNMLQWLEIVEGTTISRVTETKRLAVWL